MLILIAGLPGSGKSFFAQRLADRLGAVYVGSDKTRMEMRAMGKYSPEDKLKIYRQMATITSKHIEEGKDVVVDATFFHHTVRELFVRVSEAYAVQLYIIEVTADEAMIRKRLAKARDTSEADYAVYELIRDEFEEITMPHLVLNSTDDNVEQMLNVASQYIRR